MQTIKLFTESENGKVLFAVPKEMENKKLEITIVPVEDSDILDEEKWQKHLERVRIRSSQMTKHFGSAPFNSIKSDEDDWYRQ